jgi:hypothetical protein
MSGLQHNQTVCQLQVGLPFTDANTPRPYAAPQRVNWGTSTEAAAAAASAAAAAAAAAAAKQVLEVPLPEMKP